MKITIEHTNDPFDKCAAEELFNELRQAQAQNPDVIVDVRLQPQEEKE